MSLRIFRRLFLVPYPCRSASRYRDSPPGKRAPSRTFHDIARRRYSHSSEISGYSSALCAATRCDPRISQFLCPADASLLCPTRLCEGIESYKAIYRISVSHFPSLPPPLLYVQRLFAIAVHYQIIPKISRNMGSCASSPP